MDLGKLAMFEVITNNRLQAYTPRSQIWPEYKLITVSCFTKNSGSFFLKLGKLDREVIVTGREFQIFGPW